MKFLLSMPVVTGTPESGDQIQEPETLAALPSTEVILGSFSNESYDLLIIRLDENRLKQGY